MSYNSKIEWTDATWSPVAGCSKCSPGCLNCYAERMARRLRSICKSKRDGRNQQYLGKVDDDGNWTGEVECCDWKLDEPLRWRKPSRIFVCSMSDLFHPKVPFDFIDKIHAAMIIAIRRGHHHIYLILTKRIKRMLKYYSSNRRPQLYKILEKDYDEITGFYGINWPFPIVHLGVSISTQDEMWKAKILTDIPATVRYISFEPLLADVGEIDCLWKFRKIGGILKPHIDWIIVGCESGPKRRPCKTEWIQSIVEQCQAANVPVFIKQINVNGKVVKMPKDFPQQLPNMTQGRGYQSNLILNLANFC